MVNLNKLMRRRPSGCRHARDGSSAHVSNDLVPGTFSPPSRPAQGGTLMVAAFSANDNSRLAVAGLGQDLLDYSVEVDDLTTPKMVLNHLDAVTHPRLGLRVLAAVRFPDKASDW